VVFEQRDDRALHVHVDTLVDAMILQRADHLETGAIADVAQPLVGVPAKCPLQDVAVLGAVENCAPLLELAHAVRRFLRVKLRHPPVVQEFSAAHRVFEVRLPAIRRVHVGHRGRDAALGHHGVRFAQQRFANHANAHTFREGFNGGA